MHGMASHILAGKRIAKDGWDSADHPLGFQVTVYIVGLVDIHIRVQYIGCEHGNVLGDQRGDLLARPTPFGGESDNHMIASGKESGGICDELYELGSVIDWFGDQGHCLISYTHNINHHCI